MTPTPADLLALSEIITAEASHASCNAHAAAVRHRGIAAGMRIAIALLELVPEAEALRPGDGASYAALKEALATLTL